MPKTECNEISGTISTIVPIYANTTALAPGGDTLLLTFGFVGPAYASPYEPEDRQVSLIILGWDTAERLQKYLTSALSDRKKENKPKVKRLTKAKVD